MLPGAHYSKEFFAGCAVNLFMFFQSFTVIGNNFLIVILYLGKDCTHCVVASICI